MNSFNESFFDNEMKKLLPDYILRRKDEVKILSKLSKEEKFLEIADIAHKIKGNAATFGQTKLSELAIKLEDQAKKANSKEVESIIEEIRNYLEDL